MAFSQHFHAIFGSALFSSYEIKNKLSKHTAFLHSQERGQRAVFHARRLCKIDLSNQTWSRADFTGSDLRGANLKFSTLAGSVFLCCDMERIDGRYADFTGADMRGTILSSADLSHATLDKADFRAGTLTKPWTGGRILIDRRSSLANADFSYCSLSGTSFEGADLSGADFSGAVITATQFKGAKMDGVIFKGAIFCNTNLDDIDLPREALADAVLPPDAATSAAWIVVAAKLRQHHLWVESEGRRGMPALLDGLDLRPAAAVIGKFRLTALSAARSIAAGIDFSCTELQGANFSGADLRGASFASADLRGVCFKGAQLQHAKFLGADMRPLDLKSGGRMECDITNTSFSPEQRAEAVFA